MPKSLTVGNGNILACLDKYAQVKDFYFPHVGLENHIGEDSINRIGIFADGRLSWTSSSEWKITIRGLENANASDIVAENENLGVQLLFTDTVYNEKPILLRRVRVKNLFKRDREIRLFFGQEFNIFQSRRQDTGYYDPFNNCIVHYEGKRAFLVNGLHGERGINDYTTGLFKIEGREGSYKDAEDGKLEKNPIEHGLVDSVIAFWIPLAPEAEDTVYYWIAAGKSVAETLELNDYVLEKTPEHLLQTTHDFWSAWVNRQNFNYYGLSKECVSLFKQSLFFMRSHVDATGAVIASGDSDMLQYGRDTYSYMWPRDGAFTTLALDKAGDSNVARKFFEFCNSVITDEGYFMHKYRADGSLGSSWHPWVTKDGKIQLPIQEDETALVLYALWGHYEISRDLEFVEEIYNSFIRKTANFMALYRDKTTGLPRQSYDLWEERLGISTFTSATVYGALLAAAKFARLLGKLDAEEEYEQVAKEIKEGIMKYLYDPETGNFHKLIRVEDGKISVDKTIDISSVYGVFRFGVLSADDPILRKAFDITEERLFCSSYSAGLARYEGDNYYRFGSDVPGNPWFISTLWAVQYYIASAKDESGLVRVRAWFEWIVSLALPSGVLSEQINPYTKEQISAAPLTWSHSEFVLAVIAYLEKLEELGVCPVCAEPPASSMIHINAEHNHPEK